MKKIIISVICALIIGTTFGLVLFRDTKKDIETVFNEESPVSLFQIGVFASEENALNYHNQFSGSIIIKDEDYYRVYYGIFTNNACIQKMEEYLNENNITYYIKNINVDNQKLIDELSKFESLLVSTTDVEVFLKTNEQMLKIYLDNAGDKNAD